MIERILSPLDSVFKELIVLEIKKPVETLRFFHAFFTLWQVQINSEPAVRMIHYRALRALRAGYTSNEERGGRIVRG